MLMRIKCALGQLTVKKSQSVIWGKTSWALFLAHCRLLSLQKSWSLSSRGPVGQRNRAYSWGMGSSREGSLQWQCSLQERKGHSSGAVAKRVFPQEGRGQCWWGLRTAGHVWSTRVPAPRQNLPRTGLSVIAEELGIHPGPCAVLSHFSRVWLCNLKDCSPPSSSVHGILQARVLEWVALSFSSGSSQPRDRTCVSYVSCVGRQFLYH